MQIKESVYKDIHERFRDVSFQINDLNSYNGLRTRTSTISNYLRELTFLGVLNHNGTLYSMVDAVKFEKYLTNSKKTGNESEYVRLQGDKFVLNPLNRKELTELMENVEYDFGKSGNGFRKSAQFSRSMLYKILKNSDGVNVFDIWFIYRQSHLKADTKLSYEFGIKRVLEIVLEIFTA